MKQISIEEARSRLAELVESVERGQEGIVLCRDGKPVAELRPVTASNQSFLNADPELPVPNARLSAQAENVKALGKPR